MQNSGWIKLHRKLLGWEWFTDVNTCHLFIYLLLAASYKDEKFKGIVIKRGQHCATREELMHNTGLSAREIRTAVTKLKTTKVLSVERPNGITIYTIDKYEEWQNLSEESDQGNDQERVPRATNERPTNDQRIDKELKETKKIRIKEKEVSILSSQLSLTPTYQKIVSPIEMEFEEVWRIFPRKGTAIGSKQEAKQKFKIIRKTVSFEIILQGVKNYEIYLGISGYSSQAMFRWLAKSRWADDYTIQGNPPRKSSNVPIGKSQQVLRNIGFEE